MNITLRKISKGWIADFTELPGSPPIGSGKTKYEAIACLFVRNLTALQKLDSATIHINGKTWRSIDGKR